MRAALHDAKAHLARGARLLAALGRPANGAIHRGADLAVGRGVRRAIVERHRDVRTQLTLDFHRLFGSEKQQRAVQVRAELDPVRFDLSDFSQTEHLKAAAVA